jgi:hypothetical protein
MREASMLRRSTYVSALVTCALGAALFLPARGADASDELKPPTIDELDKLPVGIKVTHDPNPARATESPKQKTGRYFWYFKTTVMALEGDVKLTQFGSFSRVGKVWHFGNFSGKPFTSKDFADWYSCADATLKKGVAMNYMRPSTAGTTSAPTARVGPSRERRLSN